MARTRISTTVDDSRLHRCRTLLGVPDSELVDRALSALLRELSGTHERRALEQQPYEQDPALAWEVDPGPDLPYDGDVPEEVQALAAERRGEYEA